MFLYKTTPVACCCKAQVNGSCFVMELWDKAERLWTRVKNWKTVRGWHIWKLKLVDARLYFVSMFVGLLTGLVAVPYHYLLYYLFHLRSGFFASHPAWYWHIPLFLFSWGILILVFETFFHACKVDQVQHLAPVDGVLLLNHLRCILDGFFHKLHLLDPVADKTKLDIKGIEHKMVVRIADRHFADIIQGKAKVFQQQDLLKSGKILICIKTCAGFRDQRWLQDILFIIIANCPQGDMSHACKFAGRVVAVFFHKK